MFDRGQFSAPRLQDWMEIKWLPMVKECQTSNTYDYYSGTAKRHIYPHLGDVKLRDLMGHSLVSTIVDRHLMPLKSDKAKAQQRLAACIDPRTDSAEVPI